MAYTITEDCIVCGACEPACPNGAIQKRDEDVYIVEAESCTECVGFHAKPRCSFVCAFDACVPDPARRESQEELLAKFRRLHPGRAPAQVK